MCAEVRRILKEELRGRVERVASGFKDSTALSSSARLLSQRVIMPLWKQQRNAQPASQPATQPTSLVARSGPWALLRFPLIGAAVRSFSSFT